MKICTYCGRENEESATSCVGCGAEDFNSPQAADLSRPFLPAKLLAILLPKPVGPMGWISLVLRLLGLAFIVRVTIKLAGIPHNELDLKYLGAAWEFILIGALGLILFIVGWHLRPAAKRGNV